MGATFAALAERGFARYLAGQFLGSTGTWMQRVAQDWLVLELTNGSGLAVGITTALQFLPYLASPWAGVLADRISRRSIMVTSQASVLALSCGMAMAVATGQVEVPLIYGAAMVTGLAAALDGPARLAVVADIVTKAHLVNGVSLNAMAFHSARIAGPALAGALVAAWGTAIAFLAIGLTFLCALVCFLGLPARSDGDGRHLRATPALGHAVRALREHHDIAIVLGIVLLVSGVGLYFQLTTALMTREVFVGGAASFGLMSTLLAIGAVFGALATGRRGSIGLKMVVGAATVFGLVELTAGLMPTQQSYGAMLVICGASAIAFTTSALSYVQLRSPGPLRGRLMGIYTVAFYAGHPFGAPLLGSVSDRFGARATLVGPGLVVLAGMAAIAVALASRRATPGCVRPVTVPINVNVDREDGEGAT